MAAPFRFVIAGGGTGGHVFPMLAVADALRAAEPDCGILFIGTKDRIESKLVPKAGYELATIPAGGLKGKSPLSRFVALGKIPLAMIKSAFMLSRFGPHAVLGGGGYASWPVCRTAAFLKIPLALLEVNSLPGLANRKLAHKAAEAYVAFEATRERMKCETIVTGNPIRSEVRGEPPKEKEGELNILVLGGSQGAVGLNSLVIEALPLIRKSAIEVHITHQTGELDIDRVRRAYRESRVPGSAVPFIEAMGTAYRNADLVIARAGATTVAEVIAARRPTVFVPLPTAADNHQEINAGEIVSAGGGVIIHQDKGEAAALADVVIDCYHRRSQLAAMGAALAQLDHPDAAEVVAQRLITLARAHIPRVN